MKKFFMFLAAMTIMVFTANIAAAQEENTEAAPDTTEQVAAPAEEAVAATEEEGVEEIPLNQALKTKFIEGGAGFMSLIIICLIIGLALAIERILYLTFSKINAKALRMDKPINCAPAASILSRKKLAPVARREVTIGEIMLVSEK